MSEDQFTRCPACSTVFRATFTQLAAREGRVRCGHCHEVFDGNANRVALTPPSAQADTARDDSSTPADRAVVTGDDGAGVEDAEAAAIDGAAFDDDASLAFDDGAEAAKDDEIIDEDEREVAREHAAAATANEAGVAAASEPTVDSLSSEDAPTLTSEVDRGAALAATPIFDPSTGRRWSIVFAVGTTILLLLFAGQALLHFRDAIASRWPETSPALERLCAAAGCALKPLQEIGHLSIDASDLQADPAHKGLLILTATIRNRAPYTLAFPHFELTLTDTLDQAVVRRALAPRDYAAGTANVEAGIAANAGIAVKLFIDASATTQVGYRLYLFYP